MPTQRSSSDSEAPPILIVTARGSTEPAEGSRLLTPLARDISRAYPGEARVESLRYPATFDYFDPTYPAKFELGDSPVQGTRSLVRLLNEWTDAVVDGRIVLLGWSQGAKVIVDALVEDVAKGSRKTALTPRVSDSITAIALFGNPTFTAGEPFNVGEFRPAVSGVFPRRPGALDRYADRLRDYCAGDDLAAQAHPAATVKGHVAYFSNGMLASAYEFVAGRLTAGLAGAPRSSQQDDAALRSGATLPAR